MLTLPLVQTWSPLSTSGWLKGLNKTTGHVTSFYPFQKDTRPPVAVAQARGYQYLAITDHSVGRGIAHGLSEERLGQQIDEIKALNQRLDGFAVFTGIEVDIRADGTLDFAD